MSIATLSDAVLRRLVPHMDAGACLAPEPCGGCGPYTGPYCFNGRYALLAYSPKSTDCNGNCTRNVRKLCGIKYTGCCC
jgi:hypothetical protein